MSAWPRSDGEGTQRPGASEAIRVALLEELCRLLSDATIFVVGLPGVRGGDVSKLVSESYSGARQILRNADIDTLERIQTSDGALREWFFSTLIKRVLEAHINVYSPRLLTFAYWLLHRMQPAEDAVQQTWAQIIPGFGQTKIERFRGYVFRVCHNVCLDSIQGKVREKRVIPLLVAHPVSSQAPWARLGQGELRRQLRALISRLSVRDARVINLHYFGQKSVREIAELLETSEGAVKECLYRARKRLETILMAERLPLDYWAPLFDQELR